MLSTKGIHQVQIFSQLLALKLNKFLVIFQAASQFSLKLHAGQKEPIKVQIFKFLSALMKVPPIPHANFETTRLRFIQILHHCSVSCLLCIFFLKILYFGQKEPIEVKFGFDGILLSKVENV